LFRNWLAQEVLHKLGHLDFGDNTVAVQVDLIEESSEHLVSGWELTSIGKDLIQKLKSFSSFKASVSVGIILVEDLHDHDLDIFIFVNWEVQEILDEQKALEFGKNTIVVQVDFLEHSVEVRDRRLRLSFSSTEMFQSSKPLCSPKYRFYWHRVDRTAH